MSASNNEHTGLSVPIENKSNFAGAHVSVLLDEAITALAIKPDGVYVDCTYGRGGHSQAIFRRLGAHGRLIALDRDLAAIANAQEFALAHTERFEIQHAAFSALNEVLQDCGVKKVDGILLDLGISSPQIDEAGRGFSFRLDGPLDMRMDQSRGQTAEQFLADATEQQLWEVIKNYGEERFAKQIARAIVTERTNGRNIGTTRQLAKIIAGAVPKVEPGQDPATRTFQALRIFLNQELEELSLVLPESLRWLSVGGRLVVVSFHSLEDRMVKQFIRAEQYRDDLPAHFPVKAKDLPEARLVSIGKAIKPSAAEIARNPRARSAVLRVAERTGAN